MMSQAHNPGKVVIADDSARVAGEEGGDVRLFNRTSYDPSMEAALLILAGGGSRVGTERMHYRVRRGPQWLQSRAELCSTVRNVAPSMDRNK